MKKHILSIILFLMLSFTAGGQSFWDDVTISAQYAAAHYDKRLIGWSESFRKQANKAHPEKWGTWQYGVSIQQKVIDFGPAFMKIGVGYSLENMNFTRVVDHCYDNPDDFCTSIIIRSDNYNVHIVQLPLSLGVELAAGFQANVAVLPFFDVRKVARYNGAVMFENTELGFYSLEVNPGIKYAWDKIQIGLNYRLWQWKKIDRVLFSDRTIPSGENVNPILTNTYEHFNPVKFWFSLGYRLGKRE